MSCHSITFQVSYWQIEIPLKIRMLEYYTFPTFLFNSFNQFLDFYTSEKVVSIHFLADTPDKEAYSPQRQQ